MTGTDLTMLIAALVLIIIAGLLASIEAALSRISRVRVEELAREGVKGAARLQIVMSDPPRFLNVLLLLRVSAELFATVLVTVVLLDVFDTWQAVVVTGLFMTVVNYIFVGVAPRTLGRQQAERIAPRAAGVAYVLTGILGPLPPLLILIGNALTPGRGFREGPFASEAELRDLVDLAEERHVIEHGEREMIHSVFELGDTLVREVMVPRTDIVFIERTKTARQALNLALRSGFSRIPVVGENEDDVVGIAYLRDLVRCSLDVKDGEKPPRVDDVMRPPTFVPDSKPVDELLREMQAQQIHMAIVIDEYGGTAGAVTIEDILEEIVGEIADEYDRETPPVEQVDDTTTRVTARLPADELAAMFDIRVDDEDIDTVAGLMASALGRVPIPGATVTIEGLTLTAESAKGRRNRVGTVLISHPPRTSGGSDESEVA